MQPGETIKPGGSSQPEPQTTPEEPQTPKKKHSDSLPPSQEESQKEPANTGAWTFKEEADSAPLQQSFPTAAPVSWTASEYVAHDKPAGWYAMFVIGSLGVAAIIYFITKDIVSPIAIAIVGIAFAAFGARKPEVLQYAIDNAGIHIGERHYPYGMFRTFSVIEEDAVRSILLMPMQRFNLPISIYYEPADEEKIIAALGTHLPHEDRQPAAIDNFMRKIRF